MTALALTSDLVLQSQISAAAERTAVPVTLAASVDALLTQVEAGQPRLVILDLSHSGLDPGQLVPRIRELAVGTTIVAFGPHVHRQRLAAAQQAGCDLVVSRGQFHAAKDEILRQFAGQ